MKTVVMKIDQSDKSGRRPTLTRTYELYTEQELINAWESGSFPHLDAIDFIRFESMLQPKDSGEYTPTCYDYEASRWAFIYSNGRLYITSECRHDYLEGVSWDEESQSYHRGESYRTKETRVRLRFLFAAVEVNEDQQGTQETQGELNA